jgi:predicted ferric reductase
VASAWPGADGTRLSHAGSPAAGSALEDADGWSVQHWGPGHSAAVLRARLDNRVRPAPSAADLWDPDAGRGTTARGTAAVALVDAGTTTPVRDAPPNAGPIAGAYPGATIPRARVTEAPWLTPTAPSPVPLAPASLPIAPPSAPPQPDQQAEQSEQTELRPESAPPTGAPPTGPPEMFLRPATPARTLGLQRWVLRLLFLVGLAAAVLPWWLDTSGDSLTTTPALLIAAGRITGLVGGYVLLVEIVLTSRLGWLERAIGTRHLLLWHRELGGAVVVILLAHAALITVGYAGFQGVSLFRESWTLLTRYEDMVSATSATLILVGVGLLGIRALRRALPYELWHLLHLSTYLVLLFGYGHQFANGEQLGSPGPARYGWIAMYVLSLTAIFWGRIVVPVRINLRHRLRVADVVQETADTVSVYVTGRALDRLEVRAGQFFRWRFLTRGRWWQSHPFSLSAAPHEHWLRVTAKSVGDHTSSLAGLRVGARVLIGGPSGNFTAERRTRGGTLLIAAGSGIAPIRAVLEELPPGAVVIYRARDEVDVTFEQELEWLVETRHATIWYVIGRRDEPEVQRTMTPEGLRELVPDVSERDVYLCGPEAFVGQTVRILRRLRVRRRHIHTDPFEF